MRWITRRRIVDFSQKGMIMGILNATPDSFSDGGKYVEVKEAVAHAIGMLQDGAEIIDVGGESTRPGSLPVTTDEEIKRVVPVIKALREASDCLISIDTSKAVVAEAAIEAGADIVNDVTGLTGDPAMADVCARLGVGVVVMHMQGTPKTMQQSPRYHDVIKEIRAFFLERFRTLTAAGIRPQQLCFDPGIGFGKKLEHNLLLLKGMEELQVHERPLMLGVSRKSMIGVVLGLDEAPRRDYGTIALTAMGRQAGVMIHRVHNVLPNYEAMRMAEAVVEA